MSEDLNKTLIIGRLVREAELFYTNTGFPIANMSIAVNKRRKVNDEWIDEGHFFDVKLLGKRAESLAQYLVKGTQVGIEGQLKQERWEKDGLKHSKVVIEAQNIQLLSSKNSPSNSQEPGRNSPQFIPPTAQTDARGYGQTAERFEDDTIPF